LCIIKIRLVYAAEAAFVYMIDGQRELFEAMKFQASYKTIAATAETWKACDNSFSAILVSHEQGVFVPLEEWPVRVGYDEKVAMYLTKFMADAK
jgi:hypothetical protein